MTNLDEAEAVLDGVREGIRKLTLLVSVAEIRVLDALRLSQMSILAHLREQAPHADPGGLGARYGPGVPSAYQAADPKCSDCDGSGFHADAPADLRLMGDDPAAQKRWACPRCGGTGAEPARPAPTKATTGPAGSVDAAHRETAAVSPSGQAYVRSTQPAEPGHPSRPYIRDACRRRLALDGPDAQALEYALTITERERDEVRGEVAALIKQRDALELRVQLELADRGKLQAEVVELRASGLLRGCVPRSEATVADRDLTPEELERMRRHALRSKSECRLVPCETLLKLITMAERSVSEETVRALAEYLAWDEQVHEFGKAHRAWSRFVQQADRDLRPAAESIRRGGG